MKSLVIYPFGALAEHTPESDHGNHRVYGIEFDGGIVKVGRSSSARARLRAVASQGRNLGLVPAGSSTPTASATSGRSSAKSSPLSVFCMASPTSRPTWTSAGAASGSRARTSTLS